MESITLSLAINCILLTVGIFTSIKWMCWHLINDTEIVECVGNFITRSKDGKQYYIESYERVFNLIKTVLGLIWIILPIIHLLFLGMRIIV